MATVPTYLYLGDARINGHLLGGGKRPHTESPYLWGLYRNYHKFNRVVPSGPDGATGGTFNPYWDGYYGARATSTGATANTVTVAGASWTVNAFIGRKVTIESGPGAGESKDIVSNTATEITISGTWTVNPTASALRVGGWVLYHHIANLLIAGASGDNWAEAAGGGISPTTLLINALEERHPNAPGFRLLKCPLPGGFGGATGWKTTGSSWATFLVIWEEAKAAAAANGDTLDLRGVIGDMSTTDIASVNATFKADAQSWITGIRGLTGAAGTSAADCLILLVSHHAQLYEGSLAPVSPAVRALNRELTQENTNVRLFDMNWGTLGVSALGAGAVPTDANDYDTETYVQAGARMARTIDAWYTDDPVAAPGQGIACIVMIGDSQLVTASLNAGMVLYSQEKSLLGNLGFTVRVGQYIWDNVEEEVQLYDVLANTNTFGSVVSDAFGPESTLLKKLYLDQFPDGVCVFKYAKSGMALTAIAAAAGASGALEQSAGTVWDEIDAAWQKFRAAVYRDTGRTPDVQGVLLSYGSNDAISAAAAAAFATAAPAYIDDLRDLLTTRTSGPELGFVVLQPAPHIDSGAPGGTTLYTLETMTSVRATVAALATARPRVRVLLNSGGDQYELQRSDNVHFGGEAVFQIGYDAAEAFIALIDEEGETAAATSTPSESAAFTVEDGSGLASANSYATVAFADTYNDAYDNPVEWSGASQAAKQNALRYATRAADERYGLRWYGYRVTSEQALDWPRWCVTDSAGFQIDQETVPIRLQQWTARAAVLRLQGYDLMPQRRTTADIQSESKTMAGGFSKSVTYLGSKPADDQFPALDRMLSTAGLIPAGGCWQQASA